MKKPILAILAAFCVGNAIAGLTRIGGNMRVTAWKGDKHGGNMAL